MRRRFACLFNPLQSSKRRALHLPLLFRSLPHPFPPLPYISRPSGSMGITTARSNPASVKVICLGLGRTGVRILFLLLELIDSLIY
jgi:hypothetical protein